MTLLCMAASMLLMRHERGQYHLACDLEASLHYGISERGLGMRLWRIRCYVTGFIWK